MKRIKATFDRTRIDLNDLIMLAGAIALITGVAQVALALAWVVAGLLLIGYGILRDVT